MGLKLPTADTNFKQRQSSLGVVASNVYTQMGSAQGIINFPTPEVPLATLVTAINSYNTALGNAKRGSKDDTTAKNNARAALEGLLRTQAIYVTGVAQQSTPVAQANARQIAAMQAIILSSGFKINKRPLPPAGSVGIKKPIVRQAISKTPGTLYVLLRQYTKVKKATKVWELLYRTSEIPPVPPATTPTPAGPWTVATFTSGSITVEGLTSGIFYDWQVGAVGGHNTKLNVQNPVVYTAVKKVVIT